MISMLRGMYYSVWALGLQEIQRQKAVQREQQKLEDLRVMEYLKQKEVGFPLLNEYISHPFPFLPPSSVKRN